MATIEARTMAKKEPRNASSPTKASTTSAPEFETVRRNKKNTGLRYSFCCILGDDLGDRSATLKRNLSWWIDELTAEHSDDCTNPVPIIQSDNGHKIFTKLESKLEASVEDGAPITTPWHCSRARMGTDLIIGFNGYQDHCKYSQIMTNTISNVPCR